MEQRTRARQLRNEPTEAERRLWTVLAGRKLAGIRFNRQVPVGPYICDFVARSARLIIEVDGGQHAESPQDAARTRFLETQGFRVLRFWNNDILGNLEGVAAEIERMAADVPSPSPSRKREGNPALPSRLREGSGEGTFPAAERP